MSDTLGANDLPDMRTAVLDDDGVRALLRDVTNCTTVLHVSVKRSAGYAGDERIDLEGARDLLLSGKARGMQIRYQYDGREYCDTLLRSQDGIRLVRV